MRTNFKKGKAIRFHPNIKVAQIKSANVVRTSAPTRKKCRTGPNDSSKERAHVYGNSLQQLQLAQ